MIRSLQVVAGIRWQDMPIIRLNGNEPINIDFDEMSHEYRRMTYSIEHLDYDWRPSTGLLNSDYVEGFYEGNTIDDYEQSINTVQNYTHYTLQIPNDKCRPKMSGNYRLDIKDDNCDSLLLSVFFMVNEDIANVSTNTLVNTDIDNRKTHQQVEVKMDYSKLNAMSPREQIHGYVLQNGRWDNAVLLPQSTAINQQYLEWTHCRELIFDAGNVYHKFEMLDIHRNSLHVDENYWDKDQWTWRTNLWPDYVRPTWTYDEAATGGFYLRNSDDYESTTTSEYSVVRFMLQCDEAPYPLYINANWTRDLFLDRYRMNYDTTAKCYWLDVPLKYGYYTYQYLMLTPDGKAVIPPSEGSFFENPNTFNALFYYRGQTDRADRLVGVSK